MEATLGGLIDTAERIRFGLYDGPDDVKRISKRQVMSDLRPLWCITTKFILAMDRKFSPIRRTEMPKSMILIVIISVVNLSTFLYAAPMLKHLKYVLLNQSAFEIQGLGKVSRPS